MSELTDKEKAEIKILGKLMAQGIYSYMQQQQEEGLKVTDPERANSNQEQKDVMKRHDEEQTRIKQERRKRKKESNADFKKRMAEVAKPKISSQ